MDNAAQVSWLQAHTVFGTLNTAVLQAIATAAEVQTLQANRRIVLEDTPPDALYILRSGRLESYRTSPTSTAQAVSLLPGSVFPLKELLLDEAIAQTVITLSDCDVWRIPRAEFLALVQQYPEISQSLSRQLVTALDQVSAQLTYERDRQAALRPYLVPKVRRGIVGNSRYAVRQRQAIRQAQGDRQSVLIFGEPGLGKDNIAALIHFGSATRHEPMIKVNCDTLQASGADVFGRAGGKPGLLEWVGTGTFLLNNVQDLPPDLLNKFVTLLTTGEYTPIQREGGPPASPRRCEARILITSERVLPDLEKKGVMGHIIKISPLRVRKADIAAQVEYYLSLICRARNLPKPKVTPEALRRLQGYDFPGNLTELENLVERAVSQLGDRQDLTEEVFWATGNKGKQFRVNLLNAYPKLRQFLRSPWYPDRLNYGLTFGLFAVVVAILLFGPQSRDRNIALNFFWAWWWPLILLAFPFVGRLWCAVCPFMIYGEIAQKLSLWLYPRKLLPWPRQEAEKWGGWFLFGLFTLILLWEELWQLENTAYLSGCLLLLITAGAVLFSMLFERRFWCRYLCPIGGMNGLFAKLAITELRAQQGICSASCTTYQCYKGGPQKGEGQATDGCPLYSHPAQLADNRDCVLCMTCLKACPHRSVEFNLRPPGIELWTTHTPRPAEVCLLFLLFGAVFLHTLPTIAQFLGHANELDHFGLHTIAACGALLLPGSVVAIAHQGMHLAHRTIKPRPLVEVAYGYLPLVLGANLAYYLQLWLTEAGRILPVTAATFGGGPWDLPIAVAHPAVVDFLQATTLIAAFWLSLLLLLKISRQSLWRNAPHAIAMIALSSALWKVIIG